MVKSKKRKGWGKLSQAAAYAGVSRETFQRWRPLGLRFAKLESGLEMYRYDWIDEWLEEREVNPVEQIAKELLS